MPEVIEYEIDAATEAAARELSLTLTPYRRSDGADTYALTLCCGRCGGALMGNVQVLDTAEVLPLARLHLIRSHGYPANPVRVSE